MTIYPEIEQQAETMRVGDTARMYCPECRGGSFDSPRIEQSLVVTRRDYDAAYICHRNSCGIRGYAAVRGNPKTLDESLRDGLKKLGLAGYSGPLGHIDAPTKMHLWATYNIPTRVSAAHIHDAGYPWLAIDVRDADGSLTARVLRWAWWQPNPPVPKTKLFLEGDRRTCAWFYPDEPSAFRTHVVVVEDALSALRIAENTPHVAVALLGTNFGLAVGELQKAGVRLITLALDPDATETAFEIARKWAPAFNSFRVLVLDKDPKDLPLRDLKNIFS